MYADNVNFAGGKSATITLDGQILIGSSVGPNIRVSTLTAGAGISITNGNGSILITNTGGGGGGSLTTLNAQSGAATQSGGVINVIGTTGLTTVGGGMTLTISPSNDLAALEAISTNGYAVRTGSETWTTRTFQAGSGISLINADGVAGNTTITAATNVPTTFTGDSGTATPAANNINIVGTGSTATSASGSSVVVALTGLTNHAVLVGAGTGTITKVGPTSTTGQVLQSAGASADPAFSTATYPLTTTINQILFSSSANTITGLSTVNNGVLITSATGVPSILADGTTGQILTATTGSPPSWVSPATSGTVTTISVVSANGFAGTVANATSTPAITLTTTITGLLSGNGTAISGSAITQFDILVGGASNAVSSVGPGTSGQILQSGGNAANPAYSTSTYPATNAINTLLYASSANVMAALATGNDGVLITSHTGVPSFLAGGTTGQVLTATTNNPPTWAAPATSGTVTSVSGTANQVSVATGTTTPVISLVGPYTPATYTTHGVLIGEGTSSIVALAAGTAGQVLQSGGASADPTYSTATFPTTAGTSGNVLTSNGSNWTSAAPSTSGTIQFAQQNISSANFKNSFSVPIVIVSAPSAGLILIPIAWIFKLNYGGTNAFTAGGTPSIFYTTVGATNGRIAIASSNATFTGTATSYSQSQILPSSLTTIDPTANSISYQTTTSNPTGNAAGNNTVTVGVWYTTSVAIT